MRGMRHWATGLAAAASLFIGISFAQAAGPGVDTNNPQLPPPGIYLSPSDVHAMYSGGALSIVLSAVQHQPFAGQIIDRHDDGAGNEIETFNSGMSGMVSVNGSPEQPANGTGPVTTKVFGKTGNIVGTFQTEMLSMSITGTSPFGPFMLRESPTLQSTGQTSIAPIGGGMFHINSFFDVFTELSIDGGATWIPSSGSTHVDLFPDPEPTGAAMLLVVGFGAIARRRRAS